MKQGWVRLSEDPTVTGLWPIGGGWQDQVSGLMPGIKVGRSRAQLPLKVEVEEITVPEDFVQKINDHLLLVYTGKTRLARNLLQVSSDLN